MKNDGLFPIERNNYFFGKLMTEAEYETEQSYVNNKRRLLNVAFFNPGVVCGLAVTGTGDGEISVDSGIAIDGQGREMVIPDLIVTPLSELNGFSDDCGYKGHVYLCLEYDEEEVDLTRALGRGTEVERYGRVRETARLFLRYGEPDPSEICHLTSEENRAEDLAEKLSRRERFLLYLAKIYIVRWDEAYEIDKIEQVPFGQYAMDICASPGVQPASPMPGQTPAVSGQKHDDPPIVSYGTAEVRILEGAKYGSVYYSDDIPHGLGLVPVALTLGVLHIDGAVFGDAAVFGDISGYTYAARVSNDDGTFKIGVRANSRISEQTIRFVWSAAASPASVGIGSPEPARIIVKPAAARVRAFKVLHMTAERYGLPDSEISWSVLEPNGGEVTDDGVYIAPGEPGVYTITARCGTVSGSAYVIVS